MYCKNANISQIWALCPNIDTRNMELVAYIRDADMVIHGTTGHISTTTTRENNNRKKESTTRGTPYVL